jgi:hypothetical protein
MAQSEKVVVHCAMVSADKSVVENAKDATIVRRETKGIPEHVFPPMQDSRFGHDGSRNVEGPKARFWPLRKTGFVTSGHWLSDLEKGKMPPMPDTPFPACPFCPDNRAPGNRICAFG